MRREVSKDEYVFGIHEVYYDDDGNVKSYTEDSLVPVVHSVEGLEYEMKIMLKAFEKDVLLYETGEE